MSAALVTAVAGLVIAVAVLIAVVLGRTVKAEVGTVRAEFRNNGGSTLRDAVDRQGQTLERIEARQISIEQRVAALEHPTPPTPIRPRAPRKKAAS